MTHDILSCFSVFRDSAWNELANSARSNLDFVSALHYPLARRAYPSNFLALSLVSFYINFYAKLSVRLMPYKPLIFVTI